VQLPTGTVLAGDAMGEAFFPLHSAERPLFADDLETARRSIVAIHDAAQGDDVRVAHYGRLRAGSVARLAEGIKQADAVRA
jgi:hypothetical protein